MSYIISIIKDKFSNEEQQIYLTTLQNEHNIDVIVALIKRIDLIEQQVEQLRGILDDD